MIDVLLLLMLLLLLLFAAAAAIAAAADVALALELAWKPAACANVVLAVPTLVNSSGFARCIGVVLPTWSVIGDRFKPPEADRD